MSSWLFGAKTEETMETKDGITVSQITGGEGSVKTVLVEEKVAIGAPVVQTENIQSGSGSSTLITENVQEQAKINPSIVTISQQTRSTPDLTSSALDSKMAYYFNAYGADSASVRSEVVGSTSTQKESLINPTTRSFFTTPPKTSVSLDGKIVQVSAADSGTAGAQYLAGSTSTLPTFTARSFDANTSSIYKADTILDTPVKTSGLESISSCITKGSAADVIRPEFVGLTSKQEYVTKGAAIDVFRSDIEGLTSKQEYITKGADIDLLRSEVVGMTSKQESDTKAFEAEYFQSQFTKVSSVISCLTEELAVVRKDLAAESAQREQLNSAMETYTRNLTSELEAKFRDFSVQCDSSTMTTVTQNTNSAVQEVSLKIGRETEQLARQVEEMRRDMVTHSLKAAAETSDKLKINLNEELARLSQQVKDVAAKQDMLQGGMQAGLQQSSQASELKLQNMYEDLTRAQQELQTGSATQRELLLAMQEDHVQIKRQIDEYRSGMQKAVDAALVSERCARADAQTLTMTNLQQTLNSELQRAEVVNSGKHQDMKAVVADAEKRLQQAIIEVKCHMQDRQTNVEDAMKRLQQTQQTLQAELTIYKSDSDSRLNDADAKISRAMGELKVSLDERHGQAEEAVSTVRLALGDLQRDLQLHKTAMQDAHSSTTRAMAEVKQDGVGTNRATADAVTQLQKVQAELQSGLRATADTVNQLKSAQTQLQTDLAAHKSDYVREADVKLQNIMVELSAANESRSSNSEEVIRKLSALYAELQGELKSQKEDQEGRLRDADTKLQLAIGQVKSGFEEFKGQHVEGMKGILLDMQEDFARKLQSSQSELQVALLGSKTDSSEAMNRALAQERQLTEEAICKLKQAHVELQADFSRRNDEYAIVMQQVRADIQSDMEKHNSEHEGRLQNADVKVQQAILNVNSEQEGNIDRALRALRADLSGRIDFQEDAIQRIRQAHSDYQAELVTHKDGLSTLSREADAKVQQAMVDLKLEIFARHDGQDESVLKVTEALADLQAQLAGYQRNLDVLLRDSDAKLQQALAAFKVDIDLRSDGHEDSLRKVKKAHGDLQAEWSEIKGSLDAVLLDADAKVQQAVAALKMDLVVRHEELKTAYNEVQAEIVSHKETQSKDSESKVQQAAAALRLEMVGRHEGQLDEMAKLQNDMLAIKEALSKSKGDNDVVMMDVQTKVQQTMIDLQGDLAARFDAQNSSLLQLARAHADMQQEITTCKEALLTAADVKVQQAMVVLRDEMAMHQIGVDKTVQKVGQDYAEFQAEVSGRHEGLQQKVTRSHMDLVADIENLKGAILKEVESNLVGAMAALKCELVGRHEGHEEQVQKLHDDHLVIKAALTSQRSNHDAKMSDIDVQLQQAVDKIQGDLGARFDITLQQLTQDYVALQGDLTAYKSIMAGRLDGHNEALQKVMQSHSEIQRGMSNQKDDIVQVAQAAMQKTMADNGLALGARYDEHAEALKSLRQFYDVLQSQLASFKCELATHKGESHSQFLDTDAKMQQAMRDLNVDISMRLETQKEAAQKMTQARADIQGDWQIYREGLLRDVDANVQQAMRALKVDITNQYEGHTAAMQQLVQGGTNDLVSQRQIIMSDSNAKVQQAILDLRSEMVARQSSQEEAIRKFKEQILTTRSSGGSPLRASSVGVGSDAKVEQMVADLRRDVVARQAGQDEAIRKLTEQVSSFTSVTSPRGSSRSVLNVGVSSDAKVEQMVADLRSDMVARQAGQEEAIRKLTEQVSSFTSVTSPRGSSRSVLNVGVASSTDAKTERIVADLRSEMVERQNGQEEVTRKLRQALAELQEQLTTYYKGSSRSVLNVEVGSDSKVEQMVANLKSDMVARQADQDEAIRKLTEQFSSFQGLGSPRTKASSVDAKYEKLVVDLRSELIARHNGHEEATRKLRQAQAELQEQLTTYKGTSRSILSEADSKVQQAVANLKVELVSDSSKMEQMIDELRSEFAERYTNHEDTTKKLKQAHVELQETHKGSSRTILIETDTKVQQAMADLKRELSVRYTGHEESIKKLKQEQAALLEDLAAHKSESDSKVRVTVANMFEEIRGVQADTSGRYRNYDEALQKLSRAQADMQKDVTSQKDTLRKDSEAQVQQLVQAFREEIFQLYDAQDAIVSKLKQASVELQARVGEKDTTEAQLQQLTRALREDMCQLQDSHGDIVLKLQQANVELQAKVCQSDTSETQVQQLTLALREEMRQLRDAYDDVVLKLKQANLELQAKVSEAGATETQVQQITRALREEMSHLHDSHETIALKLKQSNTEVHDKVFEADTTVQKSLKAVRDDVSENQRALRSLLQAHADLQEDFASYKLMIAEQTQGSSESVQKIMRTHNDIQVEMARQSDVLIEGVDVKVQEALADIRRDIAARDDTIDDVVRQLKRSYAELKTALTANQGRADVDVKVLSQLNEMRSLFSRVDEVQESLRILQGDKGSPRSPLSVQRATRDLKVEQPDVDSAVQRATTSLKSDILAEVKSAMAVKANVDLKVQQATADLKSGILAEVKSCMSVKADKEEVDLKLQRALADLKSRQVVAEPKSSWSFFSRQTSGEDKEAEFKSKIVEELKVDQQKMDAKFEQAAAELKSSILVDLRSGIGLKVDKEEMELRISTAGSELRSGILAELRSGHGVNVTQADLELKVQQAIAGLKSGILADLKSVIELKLDQTDVDLRVQKSAAELKSSILEEFRSSMSIQGEEMNLKVQQATASLKSDILAEVTSVMAERNDVELMFSNVTSEREELTSAMGVKADKEEVDRKLQKATAELKSNLLAELRSSIMGVKADREEVEAKLQKATAELKSNIVAELRPSMSVQDEVDIKLQESAIDLKSSILAELRSSMSAQLSQEDVDAAVQKANVALKASMLSEVKASMKTDVLAELKVDVEDVNKKVQQATASMKADILSELKTAEEVLRRKEVDSKLSTATSERAELKSSIGVKITREEVDRKLQKSTAELKSSILAELKSGMGSKIGREEVDVKVQKATAELKSSILAEVKSGMAVKADLGDVDLKLQRAIANLNQGDVDFKVQSATSKLKSEIAELRSGMGVQATQGATQGDVDSKAQIAIAELKADLEQLRSGMSVQVAQGDMDSKVQQAIANADLKSDILEELKSVMVVKADKQEVELKVQRATAELQATITAEQKAYTDAKMNQEKLEMKYDLDDRIKDMQLIISSVQKAQSNFAQESVRAIEVTSTSGSSNELATAAISALQTNLTILRDETEARIAELRSSVERQFKDHKQDQENKTAQALSKLKSSFEAVHASLERSLREELSNNYTALKSEQQQKGKGLDEQMGRIWEAVESHTHDLTTTHLEVQDSKEQRDEAWFHKDASSQRMQSLQQLVVPEVFPMSARADTIVPMTAGTTVSPRGEAYFRETSAAPVSAVARQVMTGSMTPVVSPKTPMVQAMGRRISQAIQQPQVVAARTESGSYSTRTESGSTRTESGSLRGMGQTAMSRSNPALLSAGSTSILAASSQAQSRSTGQLTYSAGMVAEYLNIGGQTVPLYDVNYLRTLTYVKLREYAMLLYGVLGSSIGRPVPANDAELLEWITMVRDTYLVTYRLSASVSPPIFGSTVQTTAVESVSPQTTYGTPSNVSSSQVVVNI